MAQKAIWYIQKSVSQRDEHACITVLNVWVELNGKAHFSFRMQKLAVYDY